MVTKQQIEKITKIIVETVQPTKIYLFGSYSTGEATESSDMDLLVIMPDRNRKKHEIAKVLYNSIRNEANVSKDIIIDYNEKYERFCNIPFSFIGHIVKTGNLLYES